MNVAAHDHTKSCALCPCATAAAIPDGAQSVRLDLGFSSTACTTGVGSDGTAGTGVAANEDDRDAGAAGEAAG